MTATRTLDGVVLPTAGVWRIDPGHTDITFTGRHFGLTRIRGRLAVVSGEVRIAEELGRSSVEATIDMSSVSSGDQARDEHLRSDDFFAVDKHPTASFRSTGLTVEGGRAAVVGELTIKDLTRPVELTVEHLGHATDPWGNERAVLTASARIDREDWDLTWNMLLDTGGLLVSKQIDLDIDVELVRATD